MTKSVLISVVLVSLLTACGGGGASSSGGILPNPGSAPSPTPTPTQSPAVRGVAYTWTGDLHPSASASPAAMQTMQFGGGSGDPVMDEECNTQIDSQCGVAQPTIDVTETGVTAQPSTPPSVTPPVNMNVSYQQAQPPFTYDMAPITGVTPGQYTIGVKFQDGTTGTVPLNVYAHPIIGCAGGTLPSGNVPAGWSFDDNSSETTIAASDIYVTGPSCQGEFADPTAPSNGYQIHTPYGSSVYHSSTIDFATVTPSLIVSPQTAWSFATSSGPTSEGFIIGKTKSGGTFAMFITEKWDNGPNPPYTNGDWFSGAVKYAPAGQQFPY